MNNEPNANAQRPQPANSSTIYGRSSAVVRLFHTADHIRTLREVDYPLLSAALVATRANRVWAGGLPRHESQYPAQNDPEPQHSGDSIRPSPAKSSPLKCLRTGRVPS
jgi:hypothetical protein